MSAIAIYRANKFMNKIKNIGVGATVVAMECSQCRSLVAIRRQKGEA
jgi:hypothetical protein